MIASVVLPDVKIATLDRTDLSSVFTVFEESKYQDWVDVGFVSNAIVISSGLSFCNRISS